MLYVYITQLLYSYLKININKVDLWVEEYKYLIFCCVYVCDELL